MPRAYWVAPSRILGLNCQYRQDCFLKGSCPVFFKICLVVSNGHLSAIDLPGFGWFPLVCCRTLCPEPERAQHFLNRPDTSFGILLQLIAILFKSYLDQLRTRMYAQLLKELPQACLHRSLR